MWPPHSESIFFLYVKTKIIEHYFLSPFDILELRWAYFSALFESTGTSHVTRFPNMNLLYYKIIISKLGV